MPDQCPIQDLILTLLGRRYIRLTPTALERIIRTQMPDLSGKKIRARVKELVNAGCLIYSNHFSTTHLELNFHRPVRVSQRVFLSPPEFSPDFDGDSVWVKIKNGTSFGTGDHPTTRMAIQGIDHFLRQVKGNHEQVPNMRAMDIGTGSGVLAIVAVLLGVRQCVGIDIDPVACHEARENIKLNKLTDKIQISENPIENLDPNNFSLIMANLRPPTLRQLIRDLKSSLTKRSYWVVSGFRTNEQKNIKSMFVENKAKVLWETQACDWSACVVRSEI